MTVVPLGAARQRHVVTSIAPITDLVRHVARDALHLHGLVPEGVNSHTFQPTPSDVKYLAMADMAILNGLYLEVHIEKLARQSGKPGIHIVKLGEQTIQRHQWVFDFSFPATHGHPNPHLWLNVAYAMTYTTLIRDHLSRFDPDRSTLYHHNAARYLATLEQLDRCVAAALGTIPLPQRKLLTYHDSWPYFAARYGLTVLGAVQPASFSEPSPREVARLIEQIRAARLPAIFGSEVFPSTVLATIAAETNVQYVNTLRDDVLPGAPGEARHSYVGMMLENVATMTRALGGNPALLTPCEQALTR